MSTMAEAIASTIDARLGLPCNTGRYMDAISVLGASILEPSQIQPRVQQRAWAGGVAALLAGG